MRLHPDGSPNVFTVRDAFRGLVDVPSERVALSEFSKTSIQMMSVPPGRRCKEHFSHHRLSWDSPSPTIDKGGGAGHYHVWHPGEHRTITTSELKRLASFPDKYVFPGNLGDVFDRVDNSVPPLLIRAVAEFLSVGVLKRRSVISRQSIHRRSYVEILEEAWALSRLPRETDAPTVISTFAGGGGSSLGYHMAGYRELLAVEWDDNAVDTLRTNFPHLDVYHGDIAKLSVDDVLTRTGLAVGRLDVLDGSPPCQGFSTAGKRDMGDERNQLFREYVRLLRGLRPRVFVMENVSGMVNGKMKLIFAEILRELKFSGYVVSARLLNAKHYGVPQSRERMIFVGVRDDLSAEIGCDLTKKSTSGDHPDSGGAAPTRTLHLDEEDSDDLEF